MKPLLMMAFAMMLLTACEKTVLPENENPTGGIGLTAGTAKLNLSARASGDIENEEITEGRVYVFNQEGSCVQVLTMNEENQQFSAQLPAGQYTLYVVGGDDLTRFALPSREEATPTSVITRLQGKVMDDLMMASAVVNLAEGEDLNQNIELQHKVICLDDIEIRQVPETATKVEVTFSPLYSAICLNGSFPDTPTESYTITLTKQADGTTWKATPDQMLFPSKGQPTVKVTISSSSNVLAYSYTGEILEANHHFSIVGTYQVPQGVSLSGILIVGDWGGNQAIHFDMDESDMEVVPPTAGAFYGDYYVVSADATHRTAVLLAKEKLDYTAPEKSTKSEDWLAALADPMAELEKPAGATGNWRLPTLAEVGVFSKDEQIVTFGETSGNTVNFYCLNNNVLEWAYTHKEDNSYELKHGTSGFVARVQLRPVIDIMY